MVTRIRIKLQVLNYDLNKSCQHQAIGSSTKLIEWRALSCKIRYCCNCKISIYPWVFDVKHGMVSVFSPVKSALQQPLLALAWDRVGIGHRGSWGDPSSDIEPCHTCAGHPLSVHLLRLHREADFASHLLVRTSERPERKCNINEWISWSRWMR